MDGKEYLSRVKSYIKTPTKDMEEQLNDFLRKCSYVSGQYDQDEPFIRLKEHLEDLEQGRPQNNRIFYMALPPSVFTTVSQHLKRNCYPSRGVARLIVSARGFYQKKTLLAGTDVGICTHRSRSHLGRTSRAPESSRKHLSQIGRRRRFSVSITT